MADTTPPRRQAQILLTVDQYERFKALQLRLSPNKVMGTPQPAKGTDVIEAMLSSLETELSTKTGE